MGQEDLMSILRKVAVIIRSYNNRHVEKVVKNYLDMGLGLVLVVVNSTHDKGSTRGWLADINDPRLMILDIFEGYSWTSALNRGVMAIHMANLRDQKIDFVMNASVEALFTKDQALSMVHEFADDSVGVVGTSFDARQDGNSISTGRSYRHPRNTGMMIRLSTFGVVLGCFDGYCDNVGGMEDIDFILAMLALSPYRVKMLNLRVKLIVGVNYNQSQKEEREQAAMDKIIARWRSLFLPDTVERKQIDGVIASMELEVQ